MTAETDMVRRRWIAAAAGLLVLAGMGPSVVEPMARRIRIAYAPDAERDRASAVVQAFRGLQVSLADICYAKSTQYQHSGIIYRQSCEDTLSDNIREERRDSTDTARVAAPKAVAKSKTREEVKKTPSAKTDAHDQEHEGHEPGAHDHKHPTIIPPAEDDFRGVVGDVERQVKPFGLEHVAHVKSEEALPWLRLATWINPDHEMSWVAMAFWLQSTRKGGRNPRAVEQAIALLEQARALNPPPRKGQPYTKQGLLYMLGHLYVMEKRDYVKALDVLTSATTRGEADFAKLDAVQRDWLSFNFRDAVEAHKELNQTEEALKVATRGVALFPDDGPLRTSLRRLKASPRIPAKNPARKK